MALQRFSPVSPDPDIRVDSDMTMARFGHLNAVVDYVNTYVVADSLQLQGDGPLTSTARYITDAGGNLSSLAISTNRIGIGTSSPTSTLQVNGTGLINGQFDVINGTANFRVTNEITSYVSLQYGNTGWASFNASETYFKGSEFFYQSGGNFRFAGNGIFGTTTNMNARVGIKGSGSTSATTSLLVQNSSGNNTLQVLDDASVVIQGNNTSSTELFRVNNSTGNYAIRTTNAYTTSFGYFGAGDPVTIIDGSVSSAFRAGLPLISPSYYAAYFSCASGDVRVGQSTTGTSANPSAILQCNTTTQGFLPPRMTTAQRTAIVSPAAGLIVYDTDTNKSYTFDGTTWQPHY